MAEIPVEAKLQVFLIDTANTGASYDLVVCLTDNSFERAANVIDASSKCGTVKMNGVKERTIQLSGIIMKTPDAGHLTEGDLNNIFEADTKFAWLFGPEDPDADDRYYTGENAIISNLTYTAPKEGPATFSATVQLNGVPVLHEGSDS